MLTGSIGFTVGRVSGGIVLVVLSTKLVVDSDEINEDIVDNNKVVVFVVSFISRVLGGCCYCWSKITFRTFGRPIY